MTRADRAIVAASAIVLFALGMFASSTGGWFIGIGLGVLAVLTVIATIADRRADRAEREEGSL